MARKKLTLASQKQDKAEPQTKSSHHHAGDHSPSETAEKFQHLKTLNSLLMKEMVDLREQASQLNSLAEHAFLSSTERDVCRILISGHLADVAEARVPAMREAGSLQASVESLLEQLRTRDERLAGAMREKDDTEVRFQLDLDLKAKLIDDLQRNFDESERGNKVAMESLLAEREADAAKISGLENKCRDLSLIGDLLKAEVGESKDAFTSLKKVEEELRSEVFDLKQKNAVSLQELEMTREAMDSLLAQREADAAKISDLEDERRDLALNEHRLRAEVGESKGAFDSLKMVEEVLRSEVLDLKQKNAVSLEKLEIIRLDFNESKRSNKEAMESLLADREADAAKIADLEDKCRDLALNEDLLKAEVGESKVSFDSLKLIEEELRSEVFDLKRKNAVSLQELEMIRVEFSVLKIEKEEFEKRSEIQIKADTLLIDELRKKIGELEKRSDVQMKESMQLIDELKVKFGELAEEKAEIERARAMDEVEIAGLQSEVEQLQLTALELQEVSQDQAKANVLLRAQISELEKSKDRVDEYLKTVLVNLSLLKKEKVEGEAHFAHQMKVTTQLVNDLKKMVAEITAEKDKIEIEATRLKEKVDELYSSASQLEGLSKDQANFIAQLQDEKDTARNELDLERGEANGLRSRVAELEKNNADAREEIESARLELQSAASRFKEEITVLRADQDAVSRDLKEEREEIRRLKSQIAELKKSKNEVKADRDAVSRHLMQEREEIRSLKSQTAELKKCKNQVTSDLYQLEAENKEGMRALSSVMEENALLERSLAEAQKDLEETMLKMKAAEENSERALSLLRNTVRVVNGAAVRDESEDAAEDEEGIQVFESELEAIKAVFESKEGRLGDLCREVGSLRCSVVEEQKKHRGLFWSWIYPTTTTAALAISVFYAAATKGH